jgi:hypothetical protein
VPTPGVRRKGILYPTGWIDDHKEVDRIMGALPHPVFGVTARPIRDSGKGKTVLLYQANRKVFGRDFCHQQTIGDCVSHGWSLLIDTLKCVQIAQGLREKFTGETATEVMYAGSRVEIGHGQAGNGDGAVGAWAAQFATQYGTLVRGKYGAVDLTTYDGNRARAWGRPGAGVPDDLEPRLREHPLKTASMVLSYAEARDAIANGYPVAVCSRLGFVAQRDRDGFAVVDPQHPWGHCTCLIGADDAYGRPGLLDMNSWPPNWIDGPKRHDQPDGSFWIDAEVCDMMFAEQDSFAGSGYVGYPKQDLDYDFLAAA